MNHLTLFAANDGWSLASVANWLFGDARRLRDPLALIEGLAAQLDAAGAKIDRLAFMSRTLHPQFAGWAVRWNRKDGARSESFEHARTTDIYVGSPVQYVVDNQRPFRQRIQSLAEAGEHASLADLRNEGMIDYLALPMPYGTELVSVITLATTVPAGLSDGDIARLTAMANLLAPLIEIIGVRRTALGLLNTFVGPRISERILQGQVRRGDGDRIDAAFWYSDLRGFTHLAETLPTAELLSLLNDYFEYCAAAATVQGGEILQFIGDAILIVFEIRASNDRAVVCNAALVAAMNAISTIADVNEQRRRSGKALIEFGLGLHVGTVTHANVGSPDRLAFNVVGPAVNMTARIQSKTKELGVPLLLSAELAKQVTPPLRSVGCHDLRGVAGSQELFTPDVS